MMNNLGFVRYVVFFVIIGMSMVTCKHGLQNDKAMQKIQLIHNAKEKKVDVLIDGDLFTSYLYPNTLKKPVLYPLITPKGTKVTRKFPLEPSVGERVDHPHHVGLWFNYGDVNGYDFWNNSEAIKPERRGDYGMIVHQSIESMRSGDDSGELKVTMDWKNPKGQVLLKEHTTFVFQKIGSSYAIDRYTTLTAQENLVDFKDNKEGMFGIRVRRELEHPTQKPGIFTDSNGVAISEPIIDNEGVNGSYINAQAVEGGDCWGKRSNWVNLRSKIDSEDISLVILDHKSNVGYPTYWHARTYGLFAANPLGQKVFSKGKEELNFKLEKGESVTFKHRVLVASQELSPVTLNEEFNSFSRN